MPGPCRRAAHVRCLGLTSVPLGGWICEACASGDPFTALSLPKPECDDAGRPVWDVTEGQISKAFRKRSLAVHPDKNPSAEAKVAFDKLNEWHRALKPTACRP